MSNMNNLDDKMDLDDNEPLDQDTGYEAPLNNQGDRTRGWTKGRLILLGVLLLLIAGAAAFMLTPKAPSGENQSKLASTEVPLDTTVTGINASNEYNAVVEQRNELGTKLAEEKQLSFTPKLVDNNIVCDDCSEIGKQLEMERKARLELEQQLATARQYQAQSDAKDAYVMPYYKDERTGQEFATDDYNKSRQEVIKEQMTRLRDNIINPATPVGSLAFVSYEKPNNPPSVGSLGVDGDIKKASKGTKGMMAGDVLYATLETAINSDVKTPVLAIVRGGSMDGARVIGQFSQQDDYVVLEFNKGTLNGRSISLSSVALDPSTTLGALADDVDHHYLLKIGAVAGAAFLQGYGQAVQLAGQQVEYVTAPGSLQAIPVQTNELSDKQIAAIALGQVGDTLSQQIKKAAERPTTVYVDRGAEIGLLLLDDVSIK